MHADLTLDGHTFTLADEYPEYDAFGPKARGGTSVVLTYKVQSGVDAAWQRAVDAGAEVVYPLVDQFYGARAGRLHDPFGHQWMMTMEIEQLSDDELQRRLAAWDEAHDVTSRGVDSI